MFPRDRSTPMWGYSCVSRSIPEAGHLQRQGTDICRTSSSGCFFFFCCCCCFFCGLLATRIHGFRLVACFYLFHSFPPPPSHLLSSSSCSSPSSTFSFSFPLFHQLTPLPPLHLLLLLSSLPPLPLPPPPPAPPPSTVPPLPAPPAPPPPLLSSSSSSSPLLLLVSVMQYYCYTDPTIGRSQVPCEFFSSVYRCCSSACFLLGRFTPDRLFLLFSSINRFSSGQFRSSRPFRFSPSIVSALFVD